MTVCDKHMFPCRELAPFPSDSAASEHRATSGDPIVADIHRNFQTCMTTFQDQTKVSSYY